MCNRERKNANQKKYLERSDNRARQARSCRDYYAKNADQLRATGRSREHRAKRLLGAARARARAAGLPYSVDAAFTKQVQAVLDAGVCELTGLPFSFTPDSAGPPPMSPSLDRIVPELGYVPGNVRVVCWAVNAALGGWGLDVAKRVAAALLSSPGPRRTFSASPVTTYEAA